MLRCSGRLHTTRSAFIKQTSGRVRRGPTTCILAERNEPSSAGVGAGTPLKSTIRQSEEPSRPLNQHNANAAGKPAAIDCEAVDSLAVDVSTQPCSTSDVAGTNQPQHENAGEQAQPEHIGWYIAAAAAAVQIGPCGLAVDGADKDSRPTSATSKILPVLQLGDCIAAAAVQRVDCAESGESSGIPGSTNLAALHETQVLSATAPAAQHPTPAHTPSDEGQPLMSPAGQLLTEPHQTNHKQTGANYESSTSLYNPSTRPKPAYTGQSLSGQPLIASHAAAAVPCQEHESILYSSPGPDIQPLTVAVAPSAPSDTSGSLPLVQAMQQVPAADPSQDGTSSKEGLLSSGTMATTSSMVQAEQTASQAPVSASESSSQASVLNQPHAFSEVTSTIEAEAPAHQPVPAAATAAASSSSAEATQQTMPGSSSPTPELSQRDVGAEPVAIIVPQVKAESLKVKPSDDRISSSNNLSASVASVSSSVTSTEPPSAGSQGPSPDNQSPSTTSSPAVSAASSVLPTGSTLPQIQAVSAPHQQVVPPQRSVVPVRRRTRGQRKTEPSSPSPVCVVRSEEEFVKEVEEEVSKPVVLYISHQVIIHSGVVQEAEIQWKTDPQLVKKKKLAAELITVLDQCARATPHVKFVHMVADTPSLQSLCKELEVPTYPSLQFWKKGEILWDCFGVFNIQRGLSEGLLYYTDTAAKGVKVSSFVPDLHTRQQVESFVSSHADQSLTVVGYFMTSLTSCVNVFPAMYAIAKAHPEVSLARVFGDADDEMWAYCVEIGLVQAPTFVFYKLGQEVGRFVGGSRADLIGQVLRYLVPSEVCPATEALVSNPAQMSSAQGSLVPAGAGASGSS